MINCTHNLILTILERKETLNTSFLDKKICSFLDNKNVLKHRKYDLKFVKKVKFENDVYHKTTGVEILVLCTTTEPRTS